MTACCPRGVFVLLAALALAGFVAVAGTGAGSIAAFPIATFVPLFLLLPIPALLLAALLPRLPASTVRYFWIVGVGILLRLLFFAPDPLLSDDVYRYLWDGRVQCAGRSPYGVEPASHELDRVEESWLPGSRVRDKVNHPEIPTAYPPVLQLWFYGVAICGGGLQLWRALLLLAEIGVGSLVASALSERGKDRRLSVLYWWHPLPILESIWSAHAEIVAVLLFMLLVWRCGRPRASRARPGRSLVDAVLLGLGGGAKLLPLGLLPWLLRSSVMTSSVRSSSGRPSGWRSAAQVVGLCVVCGATILVVSLPYLSGDHQLMMRGIRTYAESWYFNDVLFRSLGWIAGFDPEDRTLLATRVLRAGLLLAGGAVCVAAALCKLSSWRAALWITVGFVVLTPTLHPWYLLWLLPVSIVVCSPPWYLMTITILASYVAQVAWREHHIWIDSAWVRALEFGPVAAWLIVEATSRWHTRRGAPTTTLGENTCKRANAR
ncbi:MAG: hypothetical protein AB7O52_06665 [Planctomycetota bacterium]